MSDNEKDIQALINKFNHQQQAFMPQGPGQGGPAPGQGGRPPGEDMSFMGNNPITENSGPNMHAGIDNQGTMGAPVPVQPGTITPAAGPSPVATGNTCPQCDMMHPPLRPGEKCPNAVAKAMSNDSGEDLSLEIRKYLANLQNILMSQIDQKGIKDVKKLFQNITIEITKYLEGYKE